jgi:hypothetical protein
MAVRAEGTGRWPEFRGKTISSSNLEKNLVYMAAVAFSRGLPWFRSWLSGWFSVRVPISARFVCSRSSLSMTNWEAINLSLARKRPDVKGASGVSFSRKVSAETFGLYQ